MEAGVLVDLLECCLSVQRCNIVNQKQKFGHMTGIAAGLPDTLKKKCRLKIVWLQEM